jgi:hypothetical protein
MSYYKRVNDIVNSVHELDSNEEFKSFLEGDSGKSIQKQWATWVTSAKKLQDITDKCIDKSKKDAPKKQGTKKASQKAEQDVSDTPKKQSGILAPRKLSELAAELFKTSDEMNYITAQKAIVNYSNAHVEKKDGSTLIQLDKALKDLLKTEDDEISHQNIKKHIKYCFAATVST